MTTVLGADAIATKGHYYQITDELKDDLSEIRDHEGKVIETNPDEDDTKLGIERKSGVTVQARQRIQINFMMNNNQALFSHLKGNFVMPFVFVKRDSIMTQDQVKNILGDLISANKIKIPLLAAFISVAVLLVICSALLCRKH